MFTINTRGWRCGFKGNLDECINMQHKNIHMPGVIYYKCVWVCRLARCILIHVETSRLDTVKLNDSTLNTIINMIRMMYLGIHRMQMQNRM